MYTEPVDEGCQYMMAGIEYVAIRDEQVGILAGCQTASALVNAKYPCRINGDAVNCSILIHAILHCPGCSEWQCLDRQDWVVSLEGEQHAIFVQDTSTLRGAVPQFVLHPGSQVGSERPPDFLRPIISAIL